MRPIFHCEIDYYTLSPHLSLIYDGFGKLRKEGLVTLKVNCIKGHDLNGLFAVRIDDKYKVIYDAMDGFNWIPGPIEENLEYFRNNIEADFYFKRSFSKRLLDYRPGNCLIYPLGLNYSIWPEGGYPKEQSAAESVKDMVKAVIRKTPGLSRLYTTRKYFHSNDFEAYPFADKENKILFLARLWDPDDTDIEHLKAERERINQERINCIKACREAFGDRFTGGLQVSDFSLKHAGELIAPEALTGKENFLNLTKRHNICIATTGLHDSIGWKFGEYVAASRAIVAEPLKYELPGDFESGRNYLEYRNEESLIGNLARLSRDKDLLAGMMNRNFRYYNNYLRPDRMVLNTLLAVYGITNDICAQG